MLTQASYSGLGQLFIHCPGPQTILDKLGDTLLLPVIPAPGESDLEIPLSLARGRRKSITAS